MSDQCYMAYAINCTSLFSICELQKYHNINSNTTHSNAAQIIPSTQNQAIIFTDYGFIASPDSPIKCIWFDSNRCAQCASERNSQSVEHMLNSTENVQISQELMECKGRFISIAQERYALPGKYQSD